MEAMSISGELPADGSDGEEVFINEEDIIHEITIDEEGGSAVKCLACLLHRCRCLLSLLLPFQIFPTATTTMKTAATGWVRGGFCLDQLLSVHAHVSLSAFFRYLLASLLDAIEVNSQVQFVKIPEGIGIVSGPCIVVAKCRRKSGIYLFSGCHTHACCFADAVGLFEATGIVRNLASLLV